jgi:hypothetical protein
VKIFCHGLLHRSGEGIAYVPHESGSGFGGLPAGFDLSSGNGINSLLSFGGSMTPISENFAIAGLCKASCTGRPTKLI